jgi:hypothetical protein
MGPDDQNDGGGALPRWAVSPPHGDDMAGGVVDFENDRKEFTLRDAGDWRVASYPFDDLAAVMSGGKPEREFPLIRARIGGDLVELSPCLTLHNGSFLRPKYRRIRTIAFEGLGLDCPETSDDVYELLGLLPTGFVKTPEFGLGLKKEYRFVVDSVEAVAGVTKLTVSATRKTEIAGGEYVLSLDDFSTVRRAIDRTHDRALREARLDKDILTRNSLLHAVAPDRFEEAARPYKPDTVFKAVSGLPPSKLSDGDRLAAVEAVSKNGRELAAKHPERLLELKRDIELVTLEQLVAKIEDWIGKSQSEGKWQKLFAENPFILTLAFGLPATVVQGQASVGGRSFAGSGDKIADFLFRNRFTDNVTLVEIKTPQTDLFGREYRGGVHPPSRDLSGSVTQVLDQRFQLQGNLAQLLRNSERNDLETYAVRGLVLVGRTPGERSMKRSLELFRNSLHDVAVVTFDELLEKLRALHGFLSATEVTPSD